ncbi:MAG: efflux RND transporter periplasmic adaptor subunit [Calditrichales bacterium]|nr:efflux RND transporter periplasmic adaptor subunit [Calditrichales bacterium]
MRKTSLLNIIALLIISLLVIQCGGPSEGKGNKNAESDSLKSEEGSKNDKEVLDDDLIPVEVTTIAKGEISDYILLSSNLETEIMADVYSRTQGIVEKIYREEGQYVQKGDTMLSLEAKEYELTEEKARVEYERQMSNYKRLEEMHKQALLSDEELEKSKFGLQTAEIQWKEAKLSLDFMQIRTPISGRVGERLAKIGKRIQPTDKLFSVVNNSQVIAVVYVPEKNLNQLKIRQPAFISSDHLDGKQFEGWIKRISPVVDPSSGTFKVTVGVRNLKNMLRPGMFVNVHIIINTHKDVVLIPKMAVVYENEYMNLYVVKDSVAHKIRLAPGFEDNEKIEALKDIEEGDKIIVVGQAGMKDKTRVKIVAERENTLKL